jgi:hypothetical protein
MSLLGCYGRCSRLEEGLRRGRRRCRTSSRRVRRGISVRGAGDIGWLLLDVLPLNGEGFRIQLVFFRWYR